MNQNVVFTGALRDSFFSSTEIFNHVSCGSYDCRLTRL